MKIQEGLTNSRLADTPVIFSLGSFDGVHIGHQYLLSFGQKLAKSASLPLAVLTFSALPPYQMNPKEQKPLLTSPMHKRSLLEKAGVDILIEVPFTNELMERSATEFLRTLETMMTIDTWIGGPDLRFGKGRGGDWAFLATMAEKTKMKSLFFDRKICIFGKTVSSTCIRTLIQSGAFSDAKALLGRSYSFMAPCLLHESNLFHLDVSSYCLPPDGEYEARVRFDGMGEASDALLILRHEGAHAVFCGVDVCEPVPQLVRFLELTPIGPK